MSPRAGPRDRRDGGTTTVVICVAFTYTLGVFLWPRRLVDDLSGCQPNTPSSKNQVLQLLTCIKCVLCEQCRWGDD